MSCSCHINPPCSYCTDSLLCKTCDKVQHPDDGAEYIGDDTFCGQCLQKMEEAALESAANMGAPTFDRIVQNEDGQTIFFDGDHPSLIISTESWNAYKKQIGVE